MARTGTRRGLPEMSLGPAHRQVALKASPEGDNPITSQPPRLNDLAHPQI